MNRTCRKIQRTLAEGGPRALAEDRRAQDHLVDCEACYRFLEALSELDAALVELPCRDAPDAAVEALLARAETEAAAPGTAAGRAAGEGAPQPPPLPGRRKPAPAWLRRLAAPKPLGWAAAAALLLALLVLSPALLTRRPAPVGEPAEWDEAGGEGADTAPEPEREPASGDAGSAAEKLKALGYVTDDRDRGNAIELRGGSPRGPAATSPGPAAPGPSSSTAGKEGRLDALGGRAGELRRNAPLPDPTPGEPESSVEEVIIVTSESPLLDERKVVAGHDVPAAVEEGQIPTARDPWQIVTETPGALHDRIDVGGNERREEGALPGPDGSFEGIELKKQEPRGASPSYYELDTSEEMQAQTGAGTKVDAPASDLFSSGSTVPSPTPEAAAFLASRSRVDGLAFQPSTGYWASTYVPGDPALTWLQARLAAADPALLRPYTEAPPRLHDRARPAAQPFDPPEGSALALYLHADRAAVTGPSRTLLQVGLKGTPRAGGRRPALNLAVVLDLRGETPAPEAAAMRAFAVALGQARDLPDRFRLLVAGQPGGLLLEPGEFRHGPLTVALEDLFAGAEEGEAAPALSLPEAVRTALLEVSGSDDPGAPLGASGVLLLTPRPLGEAADEVAVLARSAAVAGLQLTAVGVGPGADVDELDRLALAGGGRRRLLPQASEAPALVERELAAVSRVVARAVRINVRLAPGVRLVDVPGSRRLDAGERRAAKELEESIDRRLAANLGLAADRGEDDDGIQILLPAFYAGDSYAVLLDVVVPGPGPVAEVSVRYKDLLYLENGAARARLELPRGETPPGPLEANVLKTYLAQRLYAALDGAAEALAAGRRGEALSRLRGFEALLAGLEEALPALAGDPDLANDRALLAEYVRLLEAGAGEAARERSYLTDSLRYAARRELAPPSALEGDGR